jgi:tRNA A37 threonylcarbamoyladenosine dehydratase
VCSREPVTLPDATCGTGASDGSLNCHGYGSSVVVTATFGMVAAGHVLRKLAEAANAPQADEIVQAEPALLL